MKNLIYFVLITAAFLCFTQFNFNSDKPKPVGFNHRIDDALVGDNPHPINYQSKPVNTQNDVKEPDIFLTSSVATIQLSEVSIDARTYYDLQSNSCTHYIQQDRNNPRYVHSVFMVDPIGAPGFPDRSTRYFFSDDTANTWTFMIGVPDGIRSGFPCIFLYSDGIPIIGNHSAGGNPGLGQRTQWYEDIAIGAGSFTRRDPGNNGDPADPPIWCAGTQTLNRSLLNNFIFVASKNAGDSVLKNVYTDNGFTGYTPIIDGANAGAYALATSTAGKIAIAYISGDLSILPPGSVRVIESTNNGSTFGTPQVVWTANYSTDSMGALRSIDCGYNNETINVIFGVCVQDGAGGFFPNSPSRIYFWAPNVNGGTPVMVDSARGLTGGNPTNDVFVSVCRPVIGYSSDNVSIAVAYCRARDEFDPVGNNYFDVYFKCSENNGASWSSGLRISNLSGPLRDCKYPSISDRNNKQGLFSTYHIIYQQDSIPASFVNGAGQSLARMIYAKVKVDNCGTVGINDPSSEIPANYKLMQNYPNPFNPKTQIEFGLPRHSLVKLTVYDIEGKEVAVLVNQTLNAGTHRVDFEGSNYASGVYFYVLRAENYTECRKMALIK